MTASTQSTDRAQVPRGATAAACAGSLGEGALARETAFQAKDIEEALQMIDWLAMPLDDALLPQALQELCAARMSP